MLFQLFAILLVTAAVCLPARASLVVPADQPYFVFEDGHVRYVLATSYKNLAPQLIPYVQYFNEQYTKSFSWNLSETTALVLASSRNQVANGATFSIPNLETIFYPSGNNFQDMMTVKSWLYFLTAHEMSHLYQTNVKEQTPLVLSHFFGNSFLLFLFPIPIFLEPNNILPTYALEGNAVFNESRFGLGGRLYSGEVRALVYRLMNDHKVNWLRLMNNHIDFPFADEKYLVGGYFNAYLANRFGVDTVNRFFKVNSIHWINPLLLNKTFIDTYGKGYERLLADFVETTKPEAEKQNVSKAPSVESGVLVGSLNHDAQSVFFVSQVDGRRTPELFRIEKSTHRITKEDRDLEIGKLFYTEGTVLSGATVQNTTHTINSSLYGEHRKRYHKYDNWIVQDIRGGHLLEIDARHSFVETQLFLDHKFLDTSASSGILDDQGHAFYFKQHQREHVLYKNGQELGRYSGFYGKPMEVLPDGAVLFVASTRYGSSVFKFKDRHITRLAESDAIVDARMLNDHQLFVIEVTSESYQARIVEQKELNDTPADYHYNFESTEEFKTFLPDIADLKKDSRFIKQKSYFEPTQLRYSGINLLAFFTGKDFVGSTSASFTDPLQYNAVNATYLRNSFQTNSVEASYTNSRHRLGYSLGYLYAEDALSSGTTLYNRNYNTTEYLDLRYPLFIYREWQGSLGFEASDEHIGPMTYPDGIAYHEQKNVGFFTSARIQFLESFPLSYAPFRSLSLTVAHKLVADEKSFTLTDNVLAAQLQGSLDVGHENILSAGGGSGFATNHNIIVDNTYALHATPFVFTTLVPGFSARALEVEQANVGYQKVINRGFYFYQIPLSLRRFAPFARGQYFWLEQNENFDPSYNRFWMYQLGSEFELLVAHLFPVVVSASYVGSTLPGFANGLAFSLLSQFSF